VTDSVLGAVLRGALDATGAAHGWIVAVRDARFVVVAAAGAPGAGDLIGAEIDLSSPAGLAITTGQPSARQLRPDDRSASGAAGCPGVPGTLLTIPCGAAGALELADKAGAPFDIDDIEVVTLLADVAGVALDEHAEAPVPSPDDLAAELRHLRATDRVRYGVVARAVGALLGTS
jgi:hypothetical protein